MHLMIFLPRKLSIICNVSWVFVWCVARLAPPHWFHHEYLEDCVVIVSLERKKMAVCTILTTSTAHGFRERVDGYASRSP